MLARVVVLAVFSLALALPGPARAAECQFQLGFKAIRDAIPALVGDCLEDEHFNVANGNAEQRTTAHHGQGGLLVWRKADNWTAFTDGHRSWVNGPRGLQVRLNTERFDWEAKPLSAKDEGLQAALIDAILECDQLEAKAYLTLDVEVLRPCSSEAWLGEKAAIIERYRQRGERRLSELLDAEFLSLRIISETRVAVESIETWGVRDIDATTGRVIRGPSRQVDRQTIILILDGGRWKIDAVYFERQSPSSVPVVPITLPPPVTPLPVTCITLGFFTHCS